MVLERLSNDSNRLGFKKTYQLVLEKNDMKKCFNCNKEFEINEFVRMEFKPHSINKPLEYTGKIFCFACSETNFISGRLGLIVKIENDLNVQ